MPPSFAGADWVGPDWVGPDAQWLAALRAEWLDPAQHRLSRALTDVAGTDPAPATITPLFRAGYAWIRESGMVTPLPRK
ncbi:hypothetical protein C8P66_12275 [Humitalea rosea]|uniref:Uncharacterized protein n=1 Tax=Humitalea rosea TaxID=990373 RepID=A0A2W7I448_9PROT|nr:hypothetical protein C8P66_12275 [Humitalea rosea]